VEAISLGARLASDGASARVFRRLLLARRGLQDAGATDPVQMRLRALQGRAIWLRPLAADVQTVIDVFVDCEHLPPPLPHPPKAVLDLGANIGLTIAHFATLYPRAMVLGVELDADNAALCRENVKQWGQRCTVVEAGVWVHDGVVPYVRHERREVSHAIARRVSADTRMASAISLASAVARIASRGGAVDYMKMDIEGAEQDVLEQGAAWANRVRAIRVEVHSPYTTKQCATDLERLGFRTHVEHRRRSYVVGRRNGA